MKSHMRIRGVFVLAFISASTWMSLVPAASAAPAFQYNILNVRNTAPGNSPTVTFSVTNATGAAYNLKMDRAFTTAGVSRLFLQIGWDTTDYTNAGSNTNVLSPTGTPYARGAAMPIPVNALAATVVDNGNGTYSVTSPLPIAGSAGGTLAVGMEGHPAGPDATGAYTVTIPVKSAVRYFSITGPVVQRRQVVDVNKCMACHGSGRAPQLTVHGNNRTEEPQLCVICHNPNNTDIPFRVAGDGPEVPIDFKRLVHGIHASSVGFRRSPLVIIGFNHTVFDASTLIRYPAELRNCVNCHVDNGTKGTFELPLAAGVLGSTVVTGSINGGAVDADPANDRKITPIAAVCSSCHDSSEVLRHMQNTGGASFNAIPAQIGTTIRERCVNCHGAGREKDVRRVHEIRTRGRG